MILRRNIRKCIVAKPKRTKEKTEEEKNKKKKEEKTARMWKKLKVLNECQFFCAALNVLCEQTGERVNEHSFERPLHCICYNLLRALFFAPIVFYCSLHRNN